MKFEMIRHCESLRVLGAPFVPTSTIRTTRETYETRGDDILDRRSDKYCLSNRIPNSRFEITGERDVSRDASFLHSSASTKDLLFYGAIG